MALIHQTRISGWRRHLFLWGYILIVCLIMRSAFFFQNLHTSLNIPNSADAPYLLRVSAGQSFSELSQDLVARNILASAMDLQVYARLSGKASQIKAGEYELTAGMNSLDLLGKMVAGDIFYQRIRIVEGWTLLQALQEIQAHPGIVSSIDTEDREEVSSLLGTEFYPEGLLFPDTYNFNSGSTDREIVNRARVLMQEVLEEEWENRAVGLPLEDAYDALILASIIEKETGQADERELISGVFVSRLNNGMRLQTDPTVIYGLGDRFKGNLTRAHLQELTDYNTYRIDGLPPTPIALPGRESIRAALNPYLSGYLYFVARGDGSHYFSSSLEEHNAAVERFQLGSDE